MLGPRGTATITWPLVPVPGDCEDGEVGWQGKPKYSEKTCPDAILSTTDPTCQTPARTRAAAVGSQRLTASAMTRPYKCFNQLCYPLPQYLITVCITSLEP
jgi:hypothetical protein